MNKSIIALGLTVLLITSFFFGRYYERVKFRESEIKDTITIMIDKLSEKNDSIIRINDSINFKVIEIERTYEKTVDDIIRNNPHDDYSFFSTYIERFNSERYSGHDYSVSTQDSEHNIR